MKDLITRDVIYTLSAIAGAFVVYHFLFFLLSRWAQKKQRFIPILLKDNLYYPGLFVMITISLWVTLGLVRGDLPSQYFRITRHVIFILWICCCGLFLSRLVSLGGKITLRRFATDELMDYSHRKARTKFELIERIVNVLLFVATLSLVLMTFKSVRQVGSTLLASAGVLGIIIGFAAQKSIGALFAGIQIAISQPIRIGDVVVVEGEYGVIGEITLTYVVVNTWDGRRLMVPINFFLEKTFENWTRKSSEVIGQVKIRVDFTLPVDKVREEFLRLVKESPLYDGRSCGFVVTSSDHQTMEVRGTMSAKDSGDAFDLQCLVREKLIAYITANFPESLPKRRLADIATAKAPGH